MAAHGGSGISRRPQQRGGRRLLSAACHGTGRFARKSSNGSISSEQHLRSNRQADSLSRGSEGIGGDPRRADRKARTRRSAASKAFAFLMVPMSPSQRDLLVAWRTPMRRFVFPLMSLLLVLSLATRVNSQAPGRTSSVERGPRFLLASSARSEPIRVDVSRTPVLRAHRGRPGWRDA